MIKNLDKYHVITGDLNLLGWVNLKYDMIMDDNYDICLENKVSQSQKIDQY